MAIKPAINQNRFVELDKNMQSLHTKMQAVTQNSDVVKYTKKCQQQLSGDWPTGKYYCDASITLHKIVTSANEVADAQARFFPIVEQASFLKPVSELMTTPPASFGREFVVGGYEKSYKLGELQCTYLNKLDNKESSYIFARYGDAIETSDGDLSLTLSCSGLADQDWYKN